MEGLHGWVAFQWGGRCFHRPAHRPKAAAMVLAPRRPRDRMPPAEMESHPELPCCTRSCGGGWNAAGVFLADNHWCDADNQAVKDAETLRT